MSAPYLFCDTSVGDWRLFSPSFERYDQYERERLAYRDSVAENRSRYTGYYQPQHPEHMGYTGLPMPLQQSTLGAPPAQQPSIAEHNWGVQNEDFLQPNSSNSLTNQPQRNAPQTFGPQSAYEQVFRSTMSQYPHPEQPSAPYSPFIHEQGTRKPTERTVGPPLAMINATLSSSAGAFQHARRPKPPQMKTEANAHAAASDKKRHDEIVAKGFVQDDLCGQCRVKQRLTPAHKCIKIETIDKDGKVEKGRCHYCVIRRQKCAIETAQDAQDRMYGRRHKKEDEFVKKENEAVKVKKEKKTEAKKVEAQETGDARAYNAAFRAQDDHEEPWDVTQRLQQPLHGHGMPVGDAQGVPHTQGFISQIQSFAAHGHAARSHTPTDYATYPPGQPEQYRYGPQFPMPGYAESLSDNVLGVMNQGRRHTAQQLPSPIFRPQSAEQGSYYNSNRQDMYGQRTLRPPLAPAQHNPLNSNSSRYAGYSSHIAANPLKPFAPGYIGRPTWDNLHNERSRHPGQNNDKSPYNERIPCTPGPNPYGSPAQATAIGSSYHNYGANYADDSASRPFSSRHLSVTIPPYPSAPRLERMNAPVSYRPAQPSSPSQTPSKTPSQADGMNHSILRPLSFLPTDTPETVATRAGQGRHRRDASSRGLPSQTLPAGQPGKSGEGRPVSQTRTPTPKRSAVKDARVEKNTKKGKGRGKK